MPLSLKALGGLLRRLPRREGAHTYPVQPNLIADRCAQISRIFGPAQLLEQSPRLFKVGNGGNLHGVAGRTDGFGIRRRSATDVR
jgi:hypothetical protein